MIVAVVVHRVQRTQAAAAAIRSGGVGCVKRTA
jgi:hypothetical protein